MIDEYLEILDLMEARAAEFPPTLIAALPSHRQTPFHILVATLLSLRTRDAMTAECAARLFDEAETPQELATLPEERIAELIYPVGFYRNKAAQLREMAHRLLDEFQGTVPSGEQELLSFRGVGRKTANLVRSSGFGIPAICVDIHVHRICNRLGWIHTVDPDRTESALQKLFSPEHWSRINDLFVRWGQNLCTPVSPHCSKCPLTGRCSRVGVTVSR